MKSWPGKLGIVLLAAAGFAALTLWLGWWTVPVLSGLLGLRVKPLLVALAACLAWGALLGWNASAAPLLPYADRLGGLFGMPGWSLLLLTLLFAALLAWSAATLLDSLRVGDP